MVVDMLDQIQREKSKLSLLKEHNRKFLGIYLRQLKNSGILDEILCLLNQDWLQNQFVLCNFRCEAKCHQSLQFDFYIDFGRKIF